MRVLALDMSLNSTGVVHPNGTHATVKPEAGYSDGARRLWWWAQMIQHWLNDDQPERIVIERPFVMGSGRGESTLALGKLYGVIEVVIYRAQLADKGCGPIIWVPPSTLKKWACGKGNATKDMMLQAALEAYNYTGKSYDEADALHLWHMALGGDA